MWLRVLWPTGLQADCPSGALHLQGWSTKWYAESSGEPNYDIVVLGCTHTDTTGTSSLPAAKSNGHKESSAAAFSPKARCVGTWLFSDAAADAAQRASTSPGPGRCLFLGLAACGPHAWPAPAAALMGGGPHQVQCFRVSGLR